MENKINRKQHYDSNVYFILTPNGVKMVNQFSHEMPITFVSAMNDLIFITSPEGSDNVRSGIKINIVVGWKTTIREIEQAVKSLLDKDKLLLQEFQKDYLAFETGKKETQELKDAYYKVIMNHPVNDSHFFSSRVRGYMMEDDYKVVDEAFGIEVASPPKERIRILKEII